MAHEIETAVFSQAEGAGWTQLGQVIPADMARDPARIAERCGATWNVLKRPAFYQDAAGNYVAAEGNDALVRSDTGRVLALASSTRYHVDNRQPTDIFEAFRDALNAQSLEISHAAVLRGGQLIAVCARLNDQTIDLGNGDVTLPYVTLMTGYDTAHGTRGFRTSVRTVCANTLAAGLSESERKGTQRTIRASTKIEAGDLAGLIEQARASVAEERDFYTHLVNQKVSDTDALRFFADLIEIRADQIGAVDAKGKKLVSTRAENILQSLRASLASAPGASLATAAGTAYGLLNAATHYATHNMTTRDTQGDGASASRVASNLTGGAAALKSRAVSLLNQLYAVAA